MLYFGRKIRKIRGICLNIYLGISKIIKGQLLKNVVTAASFNFAGQPAGVYVLLIGSRQGKESFKSVDIVINFK